METTVMAQGLVDVSVSQVGERAPFCSEELNDLMDEFMTILCDLGMTEIDDVIDTAIARCCVKKGKREHARRLIETAFKVMHEIKTANASVSGAEPQAERPTRRES